MKNTLLFFQMIIIFTSIIGLTSCGDLDLIGIKGSGQVVSSEIETVEIEGIILEIPATVYLSQGNTQSIKIDAQQNIFNNISHTISGDVLKLYFDQPVSKSEPVVVYMTVKSLKEANINGSGSIISEMEFNTDSQLKIVINGSGDIDLIANATSVNMLISGSGSIGLVSDCNDIYGEINGSGDINLKGGQAETSNFLISGSGNINSYPFVTEYCKVKTYGSGDAYVNAIKMLEVKIIGSGDVFYKGNPGLSVNVSGSGDVIHIN